MVIPITGVRAIIPPNELGNIEIVFEHNPMRDVPDGERYSSVFVKPSATIVIGDGEIFIEE
jgi:hypothetical protein